MTDNNIPSDAPPSYQQATGSSSSSHPGPSSNPASATTETPTGRTHLEVPGSSDGIPTAYRRSMEDENRPLPKGWIRQFDPDHHHQFYVDTTKEPPRSIWVHPYDDEDYLRSLPSEERERIEQESMGRGHPTSKEDVIASHTDDEEDHAGPSSSTSAPGELPPRPGDKGKGKERSFGRKFKDKLTGTTHEEREQQRARRAEQERQMYENHLRVRRAMGEAARTGQPQWVGKDGDGKDIYIEPPMYQGGYYGRGSYGYDPYSRGGIYTTPDARYIRPPGPYGRPMGAGYGGGYGLPLMVGGGLMGGLLLGGALGGGF